tara:strand:- start:5348 stop:5773 length:426 start_codon:yes stop_codon:yes gene_type:complete
VIDFGKANSHRHPLMNLTAADATHVGMVSKKMKKSSFVTQKTASLQWQVAWEGCHLEIWKVVRRLNIWSCAPGPKNRGLGWNRLAKLHEGNKQPSCPNRSNFRMRTRYRNRLYRGHGPRNNFEISHIDDSRIYLFRNDRVE